MGGSGLASKPDVLLEAVYAARSMFVQDGCLVNGYLGNQKLFTSGMHTT